MIELIEEQKETKRRTEKELKELTELLRASGFFEGKSVMLYYDAHKGFFIPAKTPLPRAPPIHPSCKCTIELEGGRKSDEYDN